VKPVREWMGDKRVAGALAAVAVLFVGYRFVGSGTRPAPAPPVAAAEPSPAAAVPGQAPASAAPPQLPASAAVPIPPGWTGPAWAWNRNPFLRSTTGTSPAGRSAGKGNGDAAPLAPAEGPSPELRGTVVSGATGMAIFRSDRPDGGNRLVSIGGKVGGWTLSRVESYGVLLRRGKDTRVLELYRQ